MLMKKKKRAENPLESSEKNNIVTLVTPFSEIGSFASKIIPADPKLLEQNRKLKHYQYNLQEPCRHFICKRLKNQVLLIRRSAEAITKHTIPLPIPRICLKKSKLFRKTTHVQHAE